MSALIVCGDLERDPRPGRGLLEVDGLADRRVGEARLDERRREHGLRPWVEILDEVPAAGARVGPAEEVVVEADLGRHRVAR